MDNTKEIIERIEQLENEKREICLELKSLQLKRLDTDLSQLPGLPVNIRKLLYNSEYADELTAWTDVNDGVCSLISAMVMEIHRDKIVADDDNGNSESKEYHYMDDGLLGDIAELAENLVFLIGNKELTLVRKTRRPIVGYTFRNGKKKNEFGPAETYYEARECKKK